MGYYKTIDGIRYEQELLDLADKLTSKKGDGRISRDDVNKLIHSAMDGNKITLTERRTLHLIYDTYHFTEEAKNHLVKHLFMIEGDLHYDYVLISAAELAIEGKGDGRISLDDAEMIWRMVESDGKMTEVENRTLAYILERYKVTEPAIAFLKSKMN